jgi:molecular chaperone GrpE
MDLNFLKKNMKKKNETNPVAEGEKEKQTDEKINQPETEIVSEEQSLPDAETAEQSPVAKLEIELSETNDRLIRLYSEFDNYKKRVSRERIEMTKYAGSDILLSILPVIDDLERAIKSMSDSNNTEALKEGVNLILNKVKSITESHGLKPMESIGKDFDSDLHDAITNIPARSEDMKGKVVDEIEKGYYLNDKVIRHAKVIVGN